jgi:hypothetical protein
MKSDFPLYQRDVLGEYEMSDGILYEYPKVGDMIDEIVRLREYRAWAVRTRCGDRLELDQLRPASGKKK